MNSSEESFPKDYFFGIKHSNYFNYNWWNNDGYWKSVIETVKKYKINGRALDVGCAFGFLLKRLKPYFNEIHGIDVSTFAIQRAQKEASSAILKKIDINNQELPYPDGYFNLITAFDVLEHTESIEKSLKKIVKKLNKNGYLIISLPIRDTWAGKIFHIFDKDTTHINVPSRKKLFDAVEKVGLKIIERDYSLNMIFFKPKGIPVIIDLVLKKPNL